MSTGAADSPSLALVEARLLEARMEAIRALAAALEAGASLPRVLDLLGVEGKPAIMLRALLNRFDERQLAEMLRGSVEAGSCENPPIGG